MMEVKHMIRPFENNTEAFIKRLAKRSMQSERRRNAMVVISVALAAFLISFGGGYGGFPGTDAEQSDFGYL